MAAEDETGLGELLRRHRLDAGLTQRELASRSGLSIRTVGAIERGDKTAPYSRSLRLMAEALGLADADRDTLVRAGQPGAPQVAVAATAQVTAPDRPAGADRGVALGGELVPRQLPPVVRKFVGRDAEMSRLASWIPGGSAATGDTAPVALITGSAGVGKTTLAVQFAHRIAGQFPDGQLYLNLRGFGPYPSPISPGEAIRGFLEAFGVPVQRIPVDEHAQVGLYRTLLAERRVLVVLDNASSAEQVLPLLPAGGGCMAVLTCRNHLVSIAAGLDACVLPLDVLSPDEALELMTWRIGVERAASQADAVQELARLSAGLPLALAIIAGRAIGPTSALAGLAAELRAARLDALDAGDAPVSARQVFSWSYQRLSEPARRMFRRLGLHPVSEVSLGAMASLAGTSAGEARDALAELCRASMLADSQPDRYTCHDLLHAYAADRLQADEDRPGRHAALHRMLDYYLHTAHSAALAINPLRDPLDLSPPLPGVTPELFSGNSSAVAWFSAERPVLLAAVSLAAESGFARHAWQLAAVPGTFLNMRGYWQEWVSAMRTALAAAEGAADAAGQARARCELGSALTRIGSVAEAMVHLEAAIQLYEQLGNQVRKARVHLYLGVVMEDQGLFEQALGHAERALELYRAAGHKGGQAWALGNLGHYCAHLKDYQRALDSCQQALALNRELNYKGGEAAVWDSMGYIYSSLGDPAQAVSCYQNAIELQAALDARDYRYAMTLTRLGDAWAAAGNLQAARDAWRQARDLIDELDPSVAAQVKVRLAREAADDRT